MKQKLTWVVLERDPTQIDPKDISKIAIHSTWLDGERRFAA